MVNIWGIADIISYSKRKSLQSYISRLHDLFYVDFAVENYYYGYFHDCIINSLVELHLINHSEVEFLNFFKSWTELYLNRKLCLSEIAKHLRLSDVFDEYMFLLENIFNQHKGWGHSKCECNCFGFFHDYAVQQLDLDEVGFDFFIGLKANTEVIIRDYLFEWV